MNFLESQAAFALRIKNLHDTLSDQIDVALQEEGLLINRKATGIIQLLFSEGACSAAQIAERLGFSHQLATQRLAALYKNGWAISNTDPQDARRNQIQLTELGRNEAEKLQRFLPRLSEAYGDIFSEIDVDLNALVKSVNAKLKQKTLNERFPKP